MSSHYLLKITLADTHYPIWRRFVVPADITLDQLHEVVQAVMGWHNSHMHAFFVGKQQYVSAMTIACGYSDDDMLPENEYVLKSLVSKKGGKIRYWYDFGDDWMHEIVVENVNYDGADLPSAVYCLEGAGTCPPEDCGGPFGFVDFCEALADPNHPEHDDLKEWYGGKFNPDRFDLKAVNSKFVLKRPAKKTAKKTAKKAAKKTTKKTTKKAAKKMWVFVGKPGEKK